MSASQLASMQFDLYKLDGKFGAFFGNISKNVFITAYGLPGSGKSTFLIKLAGYLTKLGKVLYVASEEGLGPTFQNKLKSIEADMTNLDIAAFNTLDQIEKALSTGIYMFCFIDSINVIIDVTPHGFKKIREKYPEVAFAIIMQSNKDGNYKGKSDYSHGSDINIEVIKGTAFTRKNRFNELSEYSIFSL